MDPWQSGTAGDPSSMTGEPPKVVFWYRVFCACTALLYLIVAVAGVAFFFVPELQQGEDGELPPAIMGGILLVMGLGLGALYAAPFFIAPSKNAWIFGLVLIGLTMSSCCFWPVSIPLLIYWIRNDNKTYFGA